MRYAKFLEMKYLHATMQHTTCFSVVIIDYNINLMLFAFLYICYNTIY